MEDYICEKPGPKSVSVIKRDEKVITSCMTREYSIVYERAKGMHIFDADGKKYLDFTASVAVQNIGHDNPDVAKAIIKQLNYGTHCGFADFYAEKPVEFVETLLTFLPKHLDCAFLSNSGTESVEAAYKLARWHTNRKWTIAFHHAFHGRTMGSLSMTNSKPVQRARYSPFLPVYHAHYPNWYQMKMEPDDCADHCLNELDHDMHRFRDDLSALFIEPVQGEGGYIVPPTSFVRGVRKLCNSYDALLCDDEVQAGCFRTGKFLAIENFGVKPDIVSLSKAIGGGIPLGATVASRKLMKEWAPGSHANTFGGNLLACAAGVASLEFMRKNKLGENAVRIGKLMMKRLNEIEDDYEIIGNVRGLGLMIGVEIVKAKASRAPNVADRKAILCNCMHNGLLLLPAGESTIRICPPLIINKEQAEEGLDILEKSIKKVSAR